MKNTILTVKTILLACLLSLCLQSNAQIAEELKSNFAQYNAQALHEKVFVHIDKTFYLTGQILWFKVYTVDASLNKPIDISKIAYVEVLNNHNAPLLQAKIKLTNGIGSGSFYIPVTAVNGNYKLRAYTNLMKNFGPDVYFEQPISIVNPLVSPQATAREAKPDNDIRFFAEGGNLVEGIKSTIAFKAVGPNGKGIDISGVVINDHNDTVARFKALKFGMGRFTLTPAANATYKAIMRIGTNGSLIKDLPPVEKQGYVMHLADAGAGQLNLTVNSTVTGQQNEAVYVFVHSGQYVKLAEGINLNNGSGSISIDKGKLGEGISHITLFNSKKQPVCERLYFKRPKQLMVGAISDKVTYAPRNKVNVDVDAKSEAGKPQMADMSLSVYKLDSLQTAEPAQILSYLWLNADLKGTIESPDYYLQINSAERDEALDNLMMTQGWTRFKWADALSGQSPVFKFLPEYNGHLVTAKITETETGKPAQSQIAYLAATGKRVQLYSALSDAGGNLLFNTNNLYGANELVLQLGIEKDSVYHMEIANPFSEEYTANTLPGLSITPDLKHALQLNSIGMQAQNLYNGSNLKQYYNPGVDSTAFFGKGKTYLLDEFTRFTTMEEVLREYVAELNVTRSQKHFHIKVKDEEGVFLDGDPLVMLDGVPVFNMDRVMAIDPMKVKRLEDIDRHFYYGPALFNGILSYTTYKGDLGGVDINPHAVVLDYEGMQLQREFYSPIYDTDALAQSRVPDLRTLLYWSPAINTNAKGSTQATFYTGDDTGKYIGIVQGITADGQAGSKYFTFEVKK